MAEKLDETTIEFLRESNAIEGVYDKRSLEDAKKAWSYLIKQDEITTAVVLTTHRILMKHQPMENINKGHYRKCRAWIARHEALSYLRISEHMNRWIKTMNSYHPTALWKEAHVEYERIHPFADGNGRTGRMFMNWHRVRSGKDILVIRASERGDYYKWFRL